MMLYTKDNSKQVDILIKASLSEPYIHIRDVCEFCLYVCLYIHNIIIYKCSAEATPQARAHSVL